MWICGFWETWGRKRRDRSGSDGVEEGKPLGDLIRARIVPFDGGLKMEEGGKG